MFHVEYKHNIFTGWIFTNEFINCNWMTCTIINIIMLLLLKRQWLPWGTAIVKYNNTTYHASVALFKMGCKNSHLPSLHRGPPYVVMLQSQVKPSHCWRQTPWFAQESSWQVVLGPTGTPSASERDQAELHVLWLIMCK